MLNISSIIIIYITINNWEKLYDTNFDIIHQKQNIITDLSLNVMSDGLLFSRIEWARNPHQFFSYLMSNVENYV